MLIFSERNSDAFESGDALVYAGVFYANALVLVYAIGYINALDCRDVFCYIEPPNGVGYSSPELAFVVAKYSAPYVGNPVSNAVCDPQGDTIR